MTGSTVLRELIDATPWIDVHEHLVEERHRLRDGAYAFVEVFGEECRIPGDWSALLVGGYGLDDLVTRGPSPVRRRRGARRRPGAVAKWDVVAPYLAAARLSARSAPST